MRTIKQLIEKIEEGKKIPSGYKESVVTVTINKISKPTSMPGTTFLFKEKIYDDYLKDYISSVTVDPDEAMNAFVKAKFNKDEITRMLDDLQNHKWMMGMDIDKPFKYSITVLKKNG